MIGLFKKWVVALAVVVAGFLLMTVPEVEAAPSDVCWCRVDPFDGFSSNHECSAKQSSPADYNQCFLACGGISPYGVITYGEEHPDQALADAGCQIINNYCWCTKTDRSGCEVTKGNFIQVTECNAFCASKGQTATHFDAILRDYSTDPACIAKDCICRKEGESCRKIAPFATTDSCTLACGEGWDGVLQLPGQDLNTIPYSQGGCLQDTAGASATAGAGGACWCKTAEDVCQKVTADAAGKPILNEQSCITACQIEGAGGKTGRILKFDPTGTEDLTRSNEACKAAIQEEAKGAADIATNSEDEVARLKAQAKTSLNRVSFGSMAEVIGQVVMFNMAFMGAIAFVLYIYAGILWMVAMGNSEQIEKAKNIFIWATMGVGAILASYIVVQFLFRDILGLPI